MSTGLPAYTIPVLVTAMPALQSAPTRRFACATPLRRQKSAKPVAVSTPTGPAIVMMTPSNLPICG